MRREDRKEDNHEKEARDSPHDFEPFTPDLLPPLHASRRLTRHLGYNVDFCGLSDGSRRVVEQVHASSPLASAAIHSAKSRSL